MRWRGGSARGGPTQRESTSRTDGVDREQEVQDTEQNATHCKDGRGDEPEHPGVGEDRSARSGDSSGAGVAGDEGIAGSTRSEHPEHIIF